MIVECLTDNKNRTATNIRVLFRKGQLGASGAVSWDFNAPRRRSRPRRPQPAPTPRAAAIEAGAQDLEAGDEGATRFFTEPTDLDAVSRALGGRGWTVTRQTWRGSRRTRCTLDGAARAEVEAFLEALDEDDDVQNIYVGARRLRPRGVGAWVGAWVVTPDRACPSHPPVTRSGPSRTSSGPSPSRAP